MDERIDELEETLRLTSICGLGQVALGPVMSVLRMQREPRLTAGVPAVLTVGEALGALAPRGARGRARSAGAGRRARGSARGGSSRRARATVDGYAVRAADTYAASETCPRSSS